MPKVLIVDDDPSIVEFVKLLLDSEGYETLEANDGAAALEQIEAAEPEVVLLDYMMPNKDGLTVLRELSRSHEASFVVMVTGKGSEQIAVECMKAGALDYVVKPFDNEHLLAVIRNVLRLRESEMKKRKLAAELKELADRAIDVLERREPSSQTNNLAEVESLLQRIREKVS